MKKISLVGLCLAPVLALTACGSSDDGQRGENKGAQVSLEDLSQEDVNAYITDAKNNLKEVDTMTFSGELDELGTLGSGRMELQLTKDGECGGEINTASGVLEIAADESNSFMKAGEEFWLKSLGLESDSPSAAGVKMFADQWVLMPAESGLSDICDLDNFTEQANADGEVKDAKALAVEDVRGEQAVKISSQSTDGETIGWVSVSEPHYLVQIETDEGKLVQFSDFNEDVDIEIPAEGDYLDPSSLM